MLRLVHTADWQLGMPFTWATGDGGARLRLCREEAIDTIGRLAREHAADLILVAGDLFDANTVTDKIVVQACDRLRGIGLPVVVIPGNHDHCAGPDSVYRRRSFLEHKPDSLHVLIEPEPFLLEALGALILPAPLRQRQVVGDPTAHITTDSGRELLAAGYRIGLAHGSVVSFEGGPVGESTARIDPARAEKAGLDYLALGDWHSTMEVNARTWYSGAPEPTGFREPDSGNALLVELSAPGELPVVTRLPVGRTLWRQHRADLRDATDLAALGSWLGELTRPLDTLLRLELSGSLPFAELAELERLLDTWRHRLLHLRERGDGVLPAPSADEIEAIATDGYVRTAVEQLKAAAAAAPEGDSTALEALQLLHQIHARAEADG